MTSKIKQSIAVQRQFPDHIKENYPVFVEFVKLYYDFLQETQSQNLESIKDVDTTLEEFIDKFKDELSKNFPVELSSDKRLLLKHLREFYLSRGSEASYKFLFRTLFGKDNVDIFYPSTQMLRVSDGKWQQDVSIFVSPNGVKPDTNAIVGKTILITNSKGKVIRTFVSRIQPYSDTICEVFIQRDYINEINIGDIASCEDTGLTATILACPTKVSVYKAGKGFKVGDLYALKTQIGRGCVIKITKVGSEGEIRAIQVVRFGLDYKTKFYSYLSSKDLQAIEYHHPLTKNWGGPGLPTPYNENSGGFIDYGWGSKQTYFYYDTSIPVATPDHASDRYFANPDYVGEVVQQFYSDESQNPFDEDLAIIEVDLGAVAKYPGYYMKADGFISDEMYIQDGKYYQAFSYVIKVEEELRKYADIVKALVHPAGMKLYGEYNIFNNLEVSASMPKLFNMLQLPLTDHPPSTVITDDRGYGYNSYTTSLVDGQVITTPAEGANKVYASQGKATLLLERITSDIVENIVDLASKQYSKSVLEDVVIENEDLVVKQSFKKLQETIASITENYSVLNEKAIADNYQLLEVISKAITRGFAESLSLLESSNNELTKNSYETISSPTDEFLKELSKNISEAILAQENISSLYEKYLTDNYSINEAVNKLVTKTQAETIQSPTDDYAGVLDKTTNETLSIAEDSSNEIAKTQLEQLSLQESIVKAYEKPLVEVISLVNEAFNSVYSKPISETIVLEDIIMNSVERFRTFSDTISSIQDTCQVLKVFLLEDIFNAIFTETRIFQIAKNISEDVLLQEFIVNSVSKVLEDSISSIADSISNEFNKVISDSINSITEALSRSMDKGIDDGANALDSNSNQLEKALSDIADSPTDLLTSAFAKSISDIQEIAELLSNNAEKAISDIQTAIDLCSNELEKVLSDVTDSPTDNYLNILEKIISDLQDSSDTYSSSYEKAVEEIVDTFIEANSLGNEKSLNDVFDTGTNRENLQFILDNDPLNKVSIINPDFIFGLSSQKSYSSTKSLADTINNSTNGRIRLSPYDSENYFEAFGDYQPATSIT